MSGRISCGSKMIFGLAGVCAGACAILLIELLFELLFESVIELLSKLVVKCVVELVVKLGVGWGLLATVAIAKVREMGCNNSNESREVVIISFCRLLRTI
jgi:hypothetical protein